MLNGDTGGQSAEPATPGRMQRGMGGLSTLVGAGLAVAVLSGVAVWSWRLVERDPYEVPIIRASTDIIKDRPAKPGGAVTPHQAMQSYRASLPDTTDAAVTILPSTHALAEADQPMEVLVSRPEAAPRDAEPTAALPTALDAAAPAAGTDIAAADAPETDGPSIGPSIGRAERERIAAASALAPAASPTVLRRPSDAAARTRTAVAQSRAAERDLAARAAASPVQIQLAADPSETTVRVLWDRISRAHADLLNNRALAIETTTSGGRLFYRLRVGPFADTSEARAICQALKSRGQDCIVTRRG